MEKIKLGDMVLVTGKVVEIRDNEKGTYYSIEVKNEIAFSSSVLADQKNVIPINKG